MSATGDSMSDHPKADNARRASSPWRTTPINRPKRKQLTEAEWRTGMTAEQLRDRQMEMRRAMYERRGLS